MKKIYYTTALLCLLLTAGARAMDEEGSAKEFDTSSAIAQLRQHIETPNAKQFQKQLEEIPEGSEHPVANLLPANELQTLLDTAEARSPAPKTNRRRGLSYLFSKFHSKAPSKTTPDWARNLGSIVDLLQRHLRDIDDKEQEMLRLQLLIEQRSAEQIASLQDQIEYAGTLLRIAAGEELPHAVLRFKRAMQREPDRIRRISIPHLLIAQNERTRLQHRIDDQEEQFSAEEDRSSRSLQEENSASEVIALQKRLDKITAAKERLKLERAQLRQQLRRSQEQYAQPNSEVAELKQENRELSTRITLLEANQELSDSDSDSGFEFD